MTKTKKVCKGCLQELRVENFYPDKNYYSSYCKKCDIKRGKIRNESSVENRIKRSLRACKNRAKQERAKFDLTLEYLLSIFDKQNGKCFYTEDKLEIVAGWNVMSVDRVNPCDGYTKNNVVLCTHRANLMKSNLSIQEFKLLCKNIYLTIQKIDNNISTSI